MEFDDAMHVSLRGCEILRRLIRDNSMTLIAGVLSVSCLTTGPQSKVSVSNTAFTRETNYERGEVASVAGCHLA